MCFYTIKLDKPKNVNLGKVLPEEIMNRKSVSDTWVIVHLDDQLIPFRMTGSTGCKLSLFCIKHVTNNPDGVKKRSRPM